MLMKSFFSSIVLLVLFIFSTFLFLSCYEKTDSSNRLSPIGNDFKAYWYAGEAEISSYALQQARYGEIHEDGEAVLIFVTEDFNAKKQVKADRTRENNQAILKLNATKNFLTGVYPYSIMSSTFYPDRFVFRLHI